MPCGSFTVESESIGIGNVHIVQKVFLTRPTVKHTRNSADTDKAARRVYVKRWTRYAYSISSDVVLETRVLVSRRLEDKNESLGLEHLMLVLKKRSCSFSRLLL